MYTTTQTSSTIGWFWPTVGIAFGLLIIAIIYFVIKNNLLKKKKINYAENLVMLQVLIPREVKREDERQVKEDFKEIMSVAEQLYSSFSALYEKKLLSKIVGQQNISFEIIAKNGEILFYVGVPKSLTSYAEKQIHSLYPSAQIEANKEFKILKPNAKIACGEIKLKRRFFYPIKTYKQLENDPLNSLTNAISKLDKEDRAGVQVLIKPTSGDWRYATSRASRWVQEGRFIGENEFLRVLYVFIDSITSILRGDKAGENSRTRMNLTPQQEALQKSFQEKGAKVGFKTQIRVVVVSDNEQSANMNLENILNSFSQFTLPECNSFLGIRSTSVNKFLMNYVLREFTGSKDILNTEELTSVIHFPNQFIQTPNIKWLMSRYMPAPTNLPTEGTVIGESQYRSETKLIKIKDEDRRRHIFMIGKTGVGKTTLFENMIKQDLQEGHGVCFIDPLGDAIEHILQMIPKERAEDVIIFDPSDTERPCGLNLLEWRDPAEKDFLVAEWIEIFYKLFDPNKTGIVGPQFEHWGRNASLTVMSLPEGGTLIDIPRLFTDDAFRDKCLSYVKDPVVDSFWKQQMAKTADFHKSEMFNYFISKFGRFMTNDLMRNIIGQTKSAFNLREIMDQGKILLVNLSKGKIGETNSYLLGMILIAKIQIAAFSRADIPEDQRRDFYLFVDEFQNFTTDNFKTILSEARKYHLNLAITNQYIAQLTEPVRDAVIGNAGTLICYRIGAADAEFMTKEFPGISVQDLTNLDKFTTYVKLLIDLAPSLPFSMKGIKPEFVTNEKIAEAVRQLSRLKYGRDRASVEEEFRSRVKTEEVTAVDSELPPRESEA
jgi:hypothetical protein